LIRHMRPILEERFEEYRLKNQVAMR